MLMSSTGASAEIVLSIIGGGYFCYSKNLTPFIAYFYPVRYNVSNRAAQGRFCDMGAKPRFSPGFFIFYKRSYSMIIKNPPFNRAEKEILYLTILKAPTES